MVTSQATKAALTQAEILDGLDEAGLVNAGDPADQELVSRTRRGLEQVRLLRGFQREGVALYELAHDYLAAEVARRLDEAELGAKLAREMLRREMDNWRGSGLLIRPEILALIHEQRESLKRLTSPEAELLFRSALAAGYEEVGYWFERAQAETVPVRELALAALKAAQFRTRAAAVTALARLGTGFIAPLIQLLADDYPQVRVAAIQALERLDPTGRWRRHLKYECYVPAGPFIMGDDNGDDDEKPAHDVELDAFYIGKYPVTNTDYKRFMNDLGRAFDVPPDKANHPVTFVSWYDARDYAAWAGMRLLTEAEWEKAASWEPVREEAKERQRKGEKMVDRTGRLFKGEGKEWSNRKRQYPWGDQFDKSRCNTEVVDNTSPCYLEF